LRLLSILYTFEISEDSTGRRTPVTARFLVRPWTRFPKRLRVRPHLDPGAGAIGLGLGVLLGLGAVAAGLAVDGNASSADPSIATIDATHTPPALVLPGERVALRYDITCPPPTEVDSSGCVGSGTVFLRAGQSGPFTPMALTLDENAPQGRYSLTVPPAIAASPQGFSYYAVLRDESSGATITLPAAGAAAPQHALPMRAPIEVALDPIDLDSTARPDAEVARAAWGDGPTDVGLESGKQAPAGASSFAVSPAGEVYVLDEAHRRVLRWAGSSQPTALPLQIEPTQADLALGAKGSLYVLESPHVGSPRPLLRAFDRNGKAFGLVRLEERTAAAIDSAEGDLFTLSYPGGEWLPTMSAVDSGQPTAVQADTRRRNARQGRPSGAGREVLVLRNGNETRLALVAGNAVVRSWRLTSSVDLGEIQLAKPFGGGLLVVAHPFTDGRDQFLVLALGPKGLLRRFGVASQDWAETAPLSRFRLAGSSLYQLGSDDEATFVNRFDLGGIS
jgi:hypothetical protein